MKYERKPSWTEAEVCMVETELHSNHGPIKVKPGEWIITNGNEKYPCTDEEFRKRHIVK